MELESRHAENRLTKQELMALPTVYLFPLDHLVRLAHPNHLVRLAHLDRAT